MKQKEVLVMKHTPIIQQSLDRINEALKSVDENGCVKLRVESVVMIRSCLEQLDLQKKKVDKETRSKLGFSRIGTNNV